MTARKENAAARVGARGAKGDNTSTTKPIADKRENQGIAAARNPDQRAPTRDSPTGWHAADLLDQLMRKGRP